MNRVLITGANGFVGSSLVPELRVRGWQVRAAVRSSTATVAHPGYGLHSVRAGPLGAASDWAAALEGMDAVVHLAGWAGGSGSPLVGTELNRINVDGSARVAEQCVAMGVRRLVYLSSAKVFGETSPVGPFRVSDDPSPQSVYARSKLAAERALMEIAAGSQLEIVIIRAPMIYGPQVSGNFLRLLQLSDSGLPLPLGLIDNRRSLLFAGNLCDLIDLSLRSAAAAGQVLNASDDRDLSTRSLVASLRQLLNRPARILPCPAAALQLGGLLSGKSLLVDRFVNSLQIDATATRQRLGWRPPFSVECGLAETVAWYRVQVARERGGYRQALERTIS